MNVRRNAGRAQDYPYSANTAQPSKRYGPSVGQTIVFCGLPPLRSSGRRHKPIVCPTKYSHSRATLRKTRSRLPPRNFRMRSSEYPRRNMASVIMGRSRTSRIPRGSGGPPSKSLPSATWSSPTSTMARSSTVMRIASGMSAGTMGNCGATIRSRSAMLICVPRATMLAVSQNGLPACSVRHSKALRLWNSLPSWNPITPPLGSNALPQNFMSPIQGYGNINLYESAATANYNSLQVQLQRRAAKGLFLGVSYTWSKAMANALSGGTNDNSFVRPDQYNRMANYSPASFDRHQVLVVNYVYTLPTEKLGGNAWTKLITNGWQISGVTMAQTGAPFTPSVSVQNSSNQVVTGSYTEGWRPAIVAGCNPYTGSGNWNTYLNPACFLPAQVGSKGLESGIDYLRAPGGVNFDMALQKEFAVIRS